MCGICGQLVFDDSAQASAEGVRAMMDAMVHRGPDDQGLFCRGPVALGVRRLSIIDPAGGHQPIFSEDGSKVVVLNGAIYNYVELRRELIARGHRFATRSDTEVIVHLYEEKGPECVGDLNGMFGLALWDADRRRLMLARDRLGIKPLHYFVGPRTLLFASEINALMTAPEVPRELDPQALRDYFAFFYIPGQRTVYRAVRRLPPAHVALWRGARCALRRYWHVRYARRARRRSLDECAEGYREHLVRSVRLQLRSDVPLGVFLSGGLDSGSIVAVVAGVLNRPCKTFTVGFDDPSYDESQEAQATARRYGAEHTHFRLTPDDMLRSGELVVHFGEPYGPFMLVQGHLISKVSRRSVTVALAGDGGDELFGGYQTYIASRLAPHYLRLPPELRRGLFPRLARMLPVTDRLLSLDFKLREFVRGAEMFPRGHNMAWKVVFSDAERQQLFTRGFREQLDRSDPFAHVRQLEALQPEGSDLQKAMYVDLAMFLPDCVLTGTDRMSMAASQEVRVPILDHELVEFAATVPDEYKTSLGRTKILLRHALKDWLPRPVVRKPKTGFTTPIPVWIREQLREYVQDVLAPEAVRRTGILNPRCVQRLLDEHNARRADHARRIWAIVDFMLWHERCYRGLHARTG